MQAMGLKIKIKTRGSSRPLTPAALLQVPNTGKPAGTVAAVTKEGYKLHDRIIRPADVGVTI